MGITEDYVLFWINPGSFILQNSHLETVHVRWPRRTGYCWRSKNKLISDILLHMDMSVGWSVKTYIYQLCVDIGCHLEDLPSVMTNRDGWQKRLGNYYCQINRMMMIIIIISTGAVSKTVIPFVKAYIVNKYLSKKRK